MDRGKVLGFAPADRAGESHQMLEASACWLVLGQASRHTPKGNNTAVGQQSDTHVTVAAEGHTGKWPGE
jgi:hypothetical protein